MAARLNIMKSRDTEPSDARFRHAPNASTNRYEYDSEEKRAGAGPDREPVGSATSIPRNGRA